MRKRSQVNDAQRANGIRPVPRNDRQAEYIHALETQSQVFALGPAGTGKTFIAASMAAISYLRNRVKRIILTRPAVGLGGESLGFLPGKLEAKMAPWTQPVMEILEEGIGKQGVFDAIREGNIVVEAFQHMRGRTYRDAFVILDEAQNTTPEQMKAFVTRIGDGSIVVIDGDVEQSDLGPRNGLSMAVRMVEQYGIDAGVVTFTSEDVVRSDICKQWVQAFEMERAP